MDRIRYSASEEGAGVRCRALAVATVAALLAAEPEPRYDPATVMDCMAVVTEVRDIPRGSPLSGIHLQVTVEGGDTAMDVYLGPADFVRQFDMKFRKGDRFQIIGSRVKYGGGRVLLAREVRKEESTLYLRDKRGQPNWILWGKSPS